MRNTGRPESLKGGLASGTEGLRVLILSTRPLSPGDEFERTNTKGPHCSPVSRIIHPCAAKHRGRQARGRGPQGPRPSLALPGTRRDRGCGRLSSSQWRCEPVLQDTVTRLQGLRLPRRGPWRPATPGAYREMTPSSLWWLSWAPRPFEAAPLSDAGLRLSIWPMRPERSGSGLPDRLRRNRR